MANMKLETSWHKRLAQQFQTSEMKALSAFLRHEKSAGKIIFPPNSKIFDAFALTPFDAVKVVILGQDPYHRLGQANGLSFSVETDAALPPSLRNIYKELQDDLGLVPAPHGNLTAWGRQGVLLLNSCLTVEEARAGSHQNRGWESFTDAVMETVNKERSNIVFIFWGRKAIQKAYFIDKDRHLVISSAHPSPLSARHGFFGSAPFSKANAYLTSKGIKPINWQLT
mgnify:CR=1 FL=1